MGDESIQWPMNHWLYAGDYNSDTIKLHTYKIITNDYHSNEYGMQCYYVKSQEKHHSSCYSLK